MAEIKQQITDFAQNLDQELAQYTQGFEALDVEQQTAQLAKIKDIHYRSKYLHRLQQSLTKINN